MCFLTHDKFYFPILLSEFDFLCETITWQYLQKPKNIVRNYFILFVSNLLLYISYILFLIQTTSHTFKYEHYKPQL